MKPERELWSLYEPVHAIAYFDPTVSGCLADLGLHGFWNGYFAGRASALGAVDAAPVTALFYGFAPRMVEKAIPKVWTRVSPADAITARLDAVSRALTPLLADGSTDDVRRVTDLATATASSLDTGGRALAAAWQAVPAPEDLAARLWWSLTVIREHRGDGHVLAATYAGLDGLEAMATHVARGPMTRELMVPIRGWTEDEWDAAFARLVDRGLVAPDGTALTIAGAALRQAVEDDTDRLAGTDLDDELPLFRSVLAPLVRAVTASGGFPSINPMGVPLPQ
ncbi:MAG: hypothetical protein JWQ74_2804 [Marmoricola sp.]|nr:hypothetical protein [Marmoricola sp.]